MSAVRFTWDEARAAGNRRKHGISFAEAATIFADEDGRLKHAPNHLGT